MNDREVEKKWEFFLIVHSLYPIAFHYECLSVLKAKGKSSSFHHLFSLCRFQLFLYLESFQFCLFKCDLKLIHISINFLKNSKGLVSFRASTLLIRPDLQGPWCFEPHSSLLCFQEWSVSKCSFLTRQTGINTVWQWSKSGPIACRDATIVSLGPKDLRFDTVFLMQLYTGKKTFVVISVFSRATAECYRDAAAGETRRYGAVF